MTRATVPGSDRRTPSPPLLLASASPRRRELLALLGISFQVAAADVDEEALPGERPAALVARLAQAKALAVAARQNGRRTPASGPDVSRSGQAEAPLRCAEPPGAADVSADLRAGGLAALPGGAPLGDVVLAADTVVVLDGQILGKPRDGAEAASMLWALRGRDHRVLTGLALAAGGEIVWSSVVKTIVSMRDYDDGEVERYVRSGSPLDKAGAYGIQDADFRPVAGIEGCFTNVVGLPLCEVCRALTALGHRSHDGPGACAEACERARTKFGGAAGEGNADGGMMP